LHARPGRLRRLHLRGVGRDLALGPQQGFRAGARLRLRVGGHQDNDRQSLVRVPTLKAQPLQSMHLN
jgi:hypothetical protein